MMKYALQAALATLFFWVPLTTATASKQLPPPDPGISDEQLDSMGVNAVPFLIERLGDVKNEKHFDGLVHRLSLSALDHGPDQRIQHALQSFVNTNSQREKVPGDTLRAMRHALRAIGYTHGDGGVDYLIDWIQTGHKSVRCQDKKGRVETNASELRDAAILGLGFSGSFKARKYLEEQAKNQSEVPYKDSFRGALKDALKYSKEVEKRGLKEFVVPTIQRPQKKQLKGS